MGIGKRTLVTTIVIAVIGVAACVVKTTPMHSHRPVVEQNRKHKHQKHKHQKHKDRDHRDHDDHD
jgi:uncharacterized protein YxeA